MGYLSNKDPNQLYGGDDAIGVSITSLQQNVPGFDLIVTLEKLANVGAYSCNTDRTPISSNVGLSANLSQR
ncbi:MAG: hypothetical protein ACI81A_002406 [Paraglaciecola sp.]